MANAVDPVDLTVPDLYEALGLPRDSNVPPPGMTMDDVFARMADLYGSDWELRQGDRLRLEVDALVHFQVAYGAPVSDGGHGVLRAGTEFVVTMDPVPTAIAFPSDPVDRDEAEATLVPQEHRDHPLYGGFGVLFLKRDVGSYLTRV